MTIPNTPLRAADLRVIAASLLSGTEAEAKAGSYSDGLREEVRRLLRHADSLPNPSPLGRELLSVSMELLEAGEVKVALLRTDDALALRIPDVF